MIRIKLFQLLITSLIILLLFSCKKEIEEPVIITPIDTITFIDTITPFVSTYDTLKPESYYPVYPGSFWRYINMDGDTISRSTDTTYQIDYYYDIWDDFASDTFYVPFLNNTPIWGYKKHIAQTASYGSQNLQQILSEELGDGWTLYHIHQTPASVNRKVIAVDSTVTINNIDYFPTLVVEQYYGGSNIYKWYKRDYYTKNIGLIQETGNYGEIETVTLQLIDYYINE